MNIPTLSFEFWRLCLRDYVRNDKLLAFDALGDECLRMLWQSWALPCPCVLDIIETEQAVELI